MSTDAQSFSIRKLYLKAIRLERDAERASFLDEACENQPEIRSRLEELLAARRGDPSEELLEKAAANMKIGKGFLGSDGCPGSGDLRPEVTRDLRGRSDSHPTFCSGRRVSPINITDHPMIGHFKLLEEIGHGGMGTVYMAKQTEPVKRHVALKIIKPGMDTREVIARFEAERQALAMMDHPNIARVFDGGTTEQGRPYFVMELVRGATITEFCKQKKLSLRDRLGLFANVCKAVQHAHQKGIIHRDLKPSNVLVTMHDHLPVVKVIDFGVAKALNQELTDKTLFTQFTQMIGTPLYMSPEQAQMSGLDVDTRSDIYSLGVILYELLTGTTPFDCDTISKMGAHEFRKLLDEQDPERPSLRISTLKAKNQATIEDQRQLDTEDVARQLKRELDWIVMKALEKDRERRYETANAFAADIRRYLDNEPVEACPPTLRYRLTKYTKKHKAWLATAALLVVVLLTSTLVSVGFAVQADHARDEATESKEIAEQKKEEAVVSEKLAKQRLVAEQQARQEVEQEKERANKNYLQARQAVDQMLTRIASNHLSKLPQTAEIRLQLLRDAADFYTELLELNPRDAQTYHSRGHVYELLAEFEQVRPDFEKAVELAPDEAEFQYSLGSHLANCHDVRFRDQPLGLTHLKSAVSLNPQDFEYRKTLAQFYAHHTNDRESAVREFKKAAELCDYEAGITYCLQLAAYHANDYERVIDLAERYDAELGMAGEIYYVAAKVYSKHQEYEKVIELVTKAIAFNRKKFADTSNPSTERHFALRGQAYLNLGMLKKALDDFDRALELTPYRSYMYKRRALTHFRLQNFAKALADLAKSFEISPQDSSCVWWIPPSEIAASANQEFKRQISNLADRVVDKNERSTRSLVARVRLLLAFDRLQQAAKDLAELVQREESDLGWISFYQAGLLSAHFRKIEQYKSCCSRMVERFRKPKSSTESENHYTAWTCALVPDALENYDPPINLARDAIDQQPNNQQYLNGLGAILMRAGNYDEAKEQLDKALEAGKDDNTSSNYIRYFRAMTEHHLGNPDAAEDLLSEANASADQELAGSPAWNRRLTLELLRSEAEVLINPKSEP